MVPLLWRRTAYSSLHIVILVVVSHPYVLSPLSSTLQPSHARVCIYNAAHPATNPQEQRAGREGRRDAPQERRPRGSGRAPGGHKPTRPHTHPTPRGRHEECASTGEGGQHTRERARESATAQRAEGKGKRQQRERATRDRARLRHGRSAGVSTHNAACVSREHTHR